MYVCMYVCMYVSVIQRIDQGVLGGLGMLKEWEMREWLKECMILMEGEEG